MANEVTQDLVKELLSYDRETGVFRWKNPPANARSVQVGDVAGNVNPQGYRQIGILGEKYYAHRLAWLYEYGENPEWDIDHINGGRDDNRAENLRIAKSDAEQQQNRKLNSNNTSGFHGVSFHKPGNKWIARIVHRGKRHHLGYFDSPHDAGVAYRRAKRKLHQFCPEVRQFNHDRAGA